MGEDPGKLDPLMRRRGLESSPWRRAPQDPPHPVLRGKVSGSKRRSVESKPEAVNGKAVQAMGHVQFPAGVPCLPVLVDQEADHRGPMLLSETENSINT